MSDKRPIWKQIIQAELGLRLCEGMCEGTGRINNHYDTDRKCPDCDGKGATAARWSQI